MKIKGNNLHKLSKKLVGVMKKCTLLKDNNRRCKNYVYNGINRNIVSPNMDIMCQTGEDTRLREVEIIETKPSGSDQFIENKTELVHPWSYVKSSRSNNEKDKNTDTHNSQSRYNQRSAYYNLSSEAKSIYNDIMAAEYLNECYNRVNVERGPTFYTQPRKRAADSESSDEIYEETVIFCNEEAQTYNDYNNQNNDSPSDTQSEDSWMYHNCGRSIPDAFGFEMNPGMQIHEVNEKNTQTSRVATPMPKPFVPKLDLAHIHTFPTLTEVTEPKNESTSQPTSSVETQKSLKQKRLLEIKSQNINWLGLSPRDKIRSYFEKMRRNNESIQDSLKETPRKSINKQKRSTPKEESVNESCNSKESNKDGDSIQTLNYSNAEQPYANFNEEVIEPENVSKRTNPFVNEDSVEIIEEECDRDVNVFLNISNVEPQRAIYAEVNDGNNVTYVVYKYRKNLTDEQCNMYKNPDVILMHDKTTQVSAANLTRHIGPMELIRLLRGNDIREDFVERRSWIRRFATFFCCI